MREAIRRVALAPRSPGRRLLTALAIAIAAVGIALLASSVAPFSGAVGNIDTSFYDAFYKRRPAQSQYDGPVIIVAVDQTSIERMIQLKKVRWPWPRDTWAAVIAWLEKCGAKVVVFDLLFEDPSDHEQYIGDDTALAGMLDSCRIPVVIAEDVPTTGKAPFALPMKREPTFGACNLDDVTIRSYPVAVKNLPALAVQTLKKINAPLPEWADHPFLLHYYGPDRRADGATTFHQAAALNVVIAAQPDAPIIPAAEPELFRNRIVIIGATAAATHDDKSSPVDKIYPGTEAQATAICNLLENRRVEIASDSVTFGVGLLAALIAAAGAVTPRAAWLKLLIPLAALLAIFGASYFLFVKRDNIWWLPPAMPLFACVLAALGGLAWTYLIEGRQRRVLRKFLAQYVSPEVAERLDSVGTISLGGVLREMTLLFTDIAGFTDLSEQLDSAQLETFMNFYLSEMSAVIFACDGTLDKYIGDAIMSFWNAPLDQPDHAARACRAALGIVRRENEIRQKLAEMGAGKIHTRVGVNTAEVNVGNYGSFQKLNYTALGDGVNLASRLEGANKIYGSQILVAEPTVEQVKGQFLFRRLDLLRVKGKLKPMAVYELLAEGPGDARLARLAGEFESALAFYYHRKWDEAERALVALAVAFPDDGPIETYLKRVRDFRHDPPPDDWDGVHVAKDK